MHDLLPVVPAAVQIRPQLPVAGPVGRAWTRLLGTVLRLPVDETRVEKRGFQVDSPLVVQRIEQIGSSFAMGYNLAVRCTDLELLGRALSTVPHQHRGFAFEGAAMGLALTDWMTPGRRWFVAFLEGPAHAHAYMTWVGYGWALARLPVRPHVALGPFATVHKWLALDGYGFHAGYFDWRRSVLRQRRPGGWPADHARIFDQGLGRSLWFVYGARPAAIRTAIDTFGPARRADLWSGIGLAATYAGGVDASTLEALRAGAGVHVLALAQGAVFAAEARQRAGNLVAHVAVACRLWLGLEPEQAAQIALECLPRQGDGAGHYQLWRVAIQAACRHCVTRSATRAGQQLDPDGYREQRG